MISIEQCRAARGLLGWTQQELADIAGLSKTAINNFEKGHTDIKRESLIAIQNALENAGIQFLEGNGLRKKSEDVKILRGADIYERLLENIIKSPARHDGELLIANYTPDHQGDDRTITSPNSIQTLAERNIKTRILCTRPQPHFTQDYRILKPESFLQSGSFVVFGNTVAMQPWQQQIFIIIESEDVSLAERHRFETLWELASLPQTYTQTETAGSSANIA